MAMSSIMTSSLSLTVGCDVVIGGIKPGILRYLGRVHFAEGEWCGVELLEPDGLHDGAVGGVRYFSCPFMCGIFAPRFKVTSPEHEGTPLSQYLAQELDSEPEHLDTNSLEDLSLLTGPRSAKMKVSRSSSLKYADDIIMRLSNEALSERPDRSKTSRPKSAIVYGSFGFRSRGRARGSRSILKGIVMGHTRKSPAKRVTFSDEHDLEEMANKESDESTKYLIFTRRVTYQTDPYRALARGFDLEVRRIQGDTGIPVLKTGYLNLSRGVSPAKLSLDDGEFEKNLDQEISDVPTPDSEEMVMMKSSDDSVCSVEHSITKLPVDCVSTTSPERLNLAKETDNVNNSNNISEVDSSNKLLSSQNPERKSERKPKHKDHSKHKDPVEPSDKKSKSSSKSSHHRTSSSQSKVESGCKELKSRPSVALAHTALAQYADLLKAVQVDRAKAASKRQSQQKTPCYTAPLKSPSRPTAFDDTVLSGGTECIAASDWLFGGSSESVVARRGRQQLMKRAGGSCTNIAGERRSVSGGEDEDMEYETFDGEELNAVTDSADDISDSDSRLKRYFMIQEQSSTHYCLTSEVTHDLDSDSDDLITNVQFPDFQMDSSLTDNVDNINSTTTTTVNELDGQGNYDFIEPDDVKSSVKKINNDVEVLNNINQYVSKLEFDSSKGVKNSADLIVNNCENSQIIVISTPASSIISKDKNNLKITGGGAFKDDAQRSINENKSNRIMGGVTEDDLRGSMTSSGYMTDSAATYTSDQLTESALENSLITSSLNEHNYMMSPVLAYYQSAENQHGGASILRCAQNSMTSCNGVEVTSQGYLGGGGWKNEVEGEREERPMSLISNSSSCADSGVQEAEVSDVIPSRDQTADHCPTGIICFSASESMTHQNKHPSRDSNTFCTEQSNCSETNIKPDRIVTDQNKPAQIDPTLRMSAGMELSGETGTVVNTLNINSNNNINTSDVVELDIENSMKVRNMNGEISSINGNNKQQHNTKSETSFALVPSENSVTEPKKKQENKHSSKESRLKSTLNNGSKSDKALPETENSNAKLDKSQNLARTKSSRTNTVNKSSTPEKDLRHSATSRNTDQSHNVSSQTVASSLQNGGHSKVKCDMAEGSVVNIDNLQKGGRGTRKSERVSKDSTSRDQSVKSASRQSSKEIRSTSSRGTVKRGDDVFNNTVNNSTVENRNSSSKELIRKRNANVINSTNEVSITHRSTNRKSVGDLNTSKASPVVLRNRPSSSLSRPTSAPVDASTADKSTASGATNRDPKKNDIGRSKPPLGRSVSSLAATPNRTPRSEGPGQKNSLNKTRRDIVQKTTTERGEPSKEASNGVTTGEGRYGKRGVTLRSETRTENGSSGVVSRTGVREYGVSTRVKNEARVNKKSVPNDALQQRLQEVETKIKEYEEQIGEIEAEKARSDEMIIELQTTHQMALNDLRTSCERDAKQHLESFRNELSQKLREEREKLSRDFAIREEEYKNKLQEEEQKMREYSKNKEDELNLIQQNYTQQIRDLESHHISEMLKLKESFQCKEQQIKMEMEELKEVVREQKKKEEELVKNWNKKKEEVSRDLCLEVDSLRMIVEQRNVEIHKYRDQLNIAQEKLELLSQQQDTIERLQQKIDNLEAIISLKKDNERSLAERHTVLLRRCEQEAKDKNRISMDNEQLQWLLSNSTDPAPGDVNTYVTDCLSARRRGSASRVVGCSPRMSRSCEASTEGHRPNNNNRAE